MSLVYLFVSCSIYFIQSKSLKYVTMSKKSFNNVMLALVSTYNSNLYKLNYIEDKFTCLFCSAGTHLISLWLQIARGTSTKTQCTSSQAFFFSQ